MQGIDVFEKYQGVIDWAAVYRAGVRAAVVKLTNGVGKASPAGDHYVTGAHGAKILVGGYAFVLGSHTPESQAIAFAAELTRLKALDIAPALDFEDTSLPTSASARVAWSIAFFRQLKKSIPALTKALLYSSGSELATINVGAVNAGVSNLTIFPWDAEYGPNDGKEHAITHYKGVAAIHQFTSLGIVSGVPTKVDRDTITGDVTNPMAQPPQPQEETDMQFSDPIPLNPKPGTVGYLMRDYLHGYTGVNTAGTMALDIANTASTVNALTAALKTVTDLLAAKNGLSPTEVYDSVVKALQENTVEVDVNVAGKPAAPSTPTT